jgi:AAA domain
MSVNDAIEKLHAAAEANCQDDPNKANWRNDLAGMAERWLRHEPEFIPLLDSQRYKVWRNAEATGKQPRLIWRQNMGLQVRGLGSTGSTGNDDATGAPEPEEKPQQERKRRIQLLPYDAPDRTLIPRRSWLYGFHYMRRIVSATVGPGGIGKSSLGLVEAVSMSIGRDLFGKEELERPLRVWYHNGEDPRDEVNRRIAAICMRFGVDEQEVRKNMFVTCGLDMPIKVARGTTEVKLDKVLRADIIGVIQDEKVDVSTFDPLITMHSTSESLAVTMDPVIREIFAAIAHDTNTAVELSHHTRKKGVGQDEFTAADARGSSTIGDAVRAMRVANPMSKEEAEGFGIDELERENYFRVTRGKANMVRRGVSQWYRFDNVTLPNGNPEEDIPGDDVGVLSTWVPPELDVPINNDLRQWVRTLVTANPLLRQDAQAKNWVGKPLGAQLGLSPENRIDRARVKRVVAKLIEEGTLRVVERLDEKGRQQRNFLAAGTTYG